MHLNSEDDGRHYRATAKPIDVYVEEKAIHVQNTHAQVVDNKHNGGQGNPCSCHCQFCIYAGLHFLM
jgi:hypothetical protein